MAEEPFPLPEEPFLQEVQFLLNNIPVYLIGLVTAYVVGFIATWIIGFDDPIEN